MIGVAIARAQYQTFSTSSNFVLIAVLLRSSATVSSNYTLLTPSAYYSCPGERVTFNCVVQNGGKLYWNVEFSDSEFVNIENQRFLISNTLGSLKSIDYASGHTFEFNLTSTSPGALTSIASTIAEQRLEGTRVSCRDMNFVKNTSVIHIVQDPINIRSILIIDAIPTGNQTVTVHMNVSANTIGEEYKYFITVTPSVESGPASFVTENSIFQLSVLYNREYTVGMVANNCAGNGTLATTTFNITRCKAPMHALNVTVEGYDVNSVAIEGSQIKYYCKYGLVPRDRKMATCTNSGNWNPDPTKLICHGKESSNESQIDCGSPTLLKGARILTESYTTTEFSRITLICTEGLFINTTISSICTREGKWYPDPTKFSCLPERSESDPNSNHSDFNSKHQPLIGYVVTGLCASVFFFILGVACTLSSQWCQRRWKRCVRVAGTRNGAIVIPAAGDPQQQLSEPVYAECSLPASSQEFNTNSNIAYRHPQTKNMYIYAY